MLSDRDYLREFLAHRDERAFTGLVQQHLDLVYSAARRQVPDAATADDVTQLTFILLAQKADTIRDSEAIAGWLISATRLVALNVMRSESRRRRHESEAASMKHEAQTAANDVDWNQIQPILDEAIAQLRMQDRDALTLRYLKELSLDEIGKVLGISQRAAQKRVYRALERLRGIFALRGIATPGDALGSLLAAHAVAGTSASAHLVAQITSSAIAAPPASIVSAASITASKGILLGAATVQAKVLATAAAVIIVSGVAGTVVLRGQGAQRPSGPAAPTTQAAAPDWRAAFAAVYSLQPDELIKRVRPPFIPERTDFYREVMRSPRITPRSSMVLRWSIDHLKEGAVAAGDFDLQEVLTYTLNIWPQDVDIPRDMLFKPLDGDWISSELATPDERAAALSPLISEIIGQEKVLKSQPVEREAIVIRGQYRFVPLPQFANQRSRELRLFRSMPQADEKNVAGRVGSPPVDLMQSIGQTLQRPIVLEADISDMNRRPTELRNLSIYKSADFRRSMTPPDAATVDDILANIASQTSLELKRERRTVPTWRLVPQQ